MNWFLYAFASALFGALAIIFTRIGLAGIDPTWAATIESSVITACLVLTSIVSRKINGANVITLQSSYGWYILLAGICGGAAWVSYLIALKYGIVSKVVAIERLSFVLVLIFCVLIWNEYTSIKYLIGGILMTVGILLISM